MIDTLARLFHLQPALVVSMTSGAIHLAVAVLILVVGWWFSNRIGAALAHGLSRTHADPTLAPLIASLGSWAIRILAFIAALGEIGVATASVLAVLGAAGLAIGLALQGTLQNIAAGLMLLMLRPFRVGDVIEGSGAAAGTVSEIGLFTTRIERTDGNVVFVPNSQIWSNPIVNYSTGGAKRVNVEIDIAHRNDVDTAIGVLKKVVADEPRVLGGATLAPAVTVDSYPSDGGARLRVDAWMREPDAPLIGETLQSRATEALAEAGCRVAEATETA
ncbi:MAG TPA: mechanosensitive ion channel family protein [Pararobbsia sp.]|nr:mechanosensitive ion channel family protein [Pararobbsia sp.]